MLNLTKNLEKEIKKLQSSQGKKKSRYYIIEGLRCCQEALNRLPENDIKAVIVTSETDNNLHDIKNKLTIAEKEFNELSQTQNPQGIMILASKPIRTTLKFNDDFLLVLDRIQDPGNMGTILRTAIAIGLKEVAIINGTVDPFNPKAIRSGMGAQFSLNFDSFRDLHQLKNNQKLKSRKIWLTTPHEGISCYAPEFRLKDSILVFGEEANGILDFSTGEKTMIPTADTIESLNVAQAATVYLFEGLRQKLINSNLN